MKKLIILLAVIPLLGLFSCEKEEPPVTKSYTFRSAIGSENGVSIDYRLIERTDSYHGEYVCENEIKNYQANKAYDFIANERTNAIFIEITERTSKGTKIYPLSSSYYFSADYGYHTNIYLFYD